MALPPAPPPSGGRKKKSSAARDDGGARPSGGGSSGEKPGRNPIERLIVWGLIGLLLIGGGLVVLGDRSARHGYDTTSRALAEAIAAKNQANVDLKKAEAEAMIVGNPRRTEAQDRDDTIVRLEWKSLIRSYVANYRVSKDGVVLESWTDAAKGPQ